MIVKIIKIRAQKNREVRIHPVSCYIFESIDRLIVFCKIKG